MRDIDIRKELKTSILQKYYLDKESKVVNELGIGYFEAIIDIAVINGSLHGYEIKSEYDTLHRLPTQFAAYKKTFDFLTIITAEKHLSSLIKLVPKWCGIIIIGYNNAFSYYRNPTKNEETEKYSLAQLLWKDEAITILEELNIRKGLKGKSKPALWNLLSHLLEKDILAEKVRSKLKIRANWKSDEQLCENDGYFQLSAKL